MSFKQSLHRTKGKPMIIDNSKGIFGSNDGLDNFTEFKKSDLVKLYQLEVQGCKLVKCRVNHKKSMSGDVL